MPATTIIYEPSPQYIHLREALTQAPVQAGLLAAVDYVANGSKPWSFYAGVAFGTSVAVATSIPGAAATLYIAGDILDAAFFKSPDSSNVRIFLNGVAYSSLETFATSATWEYFQLALDDGINRIDFVNEGTGTNNSTGIPWMGIGPFNVISNVFGKKTKAQEVPIVGSENLMIWRVTYTIRDDKGANARMSYRLGVDSSWVFSEPTSSPEAFAIHIAELLDPHINGQIVNVNLSLDIGPDVFTPGALKAFPNPESDVEAGLRIPWTVNGNHPNVYMTIPTFSEAYLTHENFMDWDVWNAAIPDLANNPLDVMRAPEESAGNWTFGLVDSRGNAVNGLDYAQVRKVFKSSRKAR